MNHVCSAAATDQDTHKACLFLQLQLIMKHSVEILNRWELVYDKSVQIHGHFAILREKLKNWLLQETHHISTFFFLEEIQVQ